jgi:hypothetical protein
MPVIGRVRYSKAGRCHVKERLIFQAHAGVGGAYSIDRTRKTEIPVLLMSCEYLVSSFP